MSCIMDSRKIVLVKESFAQIPPAARKKMTRVMYNRLFELDPNLKKLFKRDIREQRKKVLKKLEYIIDNLHDAEVIGPCIKEMAVRYAQYGATPENYETFREALLFSLSAALGDEFTPAVKTAWKDVSNTISQIMIGSLD